MKGWTRVLAYFRPELPTIALALGLMALSIGASLLKPWPVGLIIDHLLSNRPPPEWLPGAWKGLGPHALLGLAALLIFLLHSFQGIFSAGQNYLSIQAGLLGLARIRIELFSWMQRLSPLFYQKRNQGDLIYRATWDTYSLQTLFQHGLFKFVASFATVGLMVAILWRVNAGLTLITLAVFPPLIGTMCVFGRRMNRGSLLAHQADGKVTSLVQQNISNLPLVQSCAREAHEAKVFAENARASFEKRIAQHRLEVIYWLVIAVWFGLATAALTWHGAREILKQELTVGELVIFLSYLGQLYEPLNQLSHVGATVSDAAAGIHRIFEILDAREEVPEASAPVILSPGGKAAARLEFTDVSFGYDPDKPVLRCIHLAVAPGETIGLIGPSGAGKSTLLNLVPRFYDPRQGAITWNGIDLRSLALKELRENVAFVFQESFLLPGTVAENIAYGKPGATRAEIEEAARLANAAEFIERLPGGYDTVVGEGAVRLSVGEKQRINLARAFLKNAPVLLLDEPTSALDAETENLVLESLGRLIAARTTILAAHRFTTLRHATRIVVLENGQITQSGTPKELLAGGGYYARLAAQAVPGGLNY